MGNRNLFRGIAITVVLLAGAVFIGTAAYNAGVSHAISISAQAVEAAPGVSGAPVIPGAPGLLPYPYPYAYGWHRPWGFFPFFPIFPILFVLFFFVVLRGLFWRGPWRRGWGGGYGGYGGHGGHGGGVPPAFEEWHRRAHADGGSVSAPDRA